MEKIEKVARAIWEAYRTEGTVVCPDFISEISWQELTDRCNSFPTEKWLFLKRAAYLEAQAAIKAMQNCDICGDFHDADNVPLSYQTGDGV